ncbi:MAG TPA: HEAT repeat domain-containing protein, partial [Acidobacteriota bacterium]|nr:HEAT repeat domain-containing protein [Acidobacteriota bacterium]
MKKTRPTVLIAAFLLLMSLAPAAAPAAGQMDQQRRQDMGLTYESLEAVLKNLQAYDTSDVGPAMRLRAYVFSNKDNPQARKEAEAALLKFVQGSPAPAGLMAACRALSLVGGADSVPVLAGLALKPETTDPARYALERIPGPAADEALVKALDKSGGDVKRGIVFSLGARKTGASVPALGKLAGGKDAALAADAIKALGKIGGAEAIKALTGALGKSAPALKAEAASALLLAAEERLKANDKTGAAGIYDKVFAAGLAGVVRQAAFKGQIAVAADPGALVLKALTGKDAELYAPALAMVPVCFGAGEIGPVAELIGRLPVGSKIQLTALLAGYPAETVRPYLLSAAEDPSLDVRLAALRAVAKAGDGKSVIFLATKAARTIGAEQDAARDALARLKGLDVDAAVLDHLAKASDEAVKAELVRAASERRVAAAKPGLMALVRTGSAALKAKAAAAL